MDKLRKMVYGGVAVFSLTTLGLLSYRNLQDKNIISVEGPVLNNNNTFLVPFVGDVIGNETPDRYWRNTKDVVDVFEKDGVPLEKVESYWIKDLKKDVQERLIKK